MALTPVDIIHTEFHTGFSGYRRTEVDNFVREARETIELLIQEKSDLQRANDGLRSEVDRYRKIESTLSDAISLAQKAADEAIAGAHRQAGLIVQEAEVARVRLTVDAQREAERYRAEIALLQATRDRFEAEFSALLGTYQQLMDRRRDSVEAQEEVA